MCGTGPGGSGGKELPAFSSAVVLPDRGGDDAAKYGLVELAAAEDAVVPAAVELVIPVAGKDSQTMAAIKSTMFGPAIAALRGE